MSFVFKIETNEREAIKLRVMLTGKSSSGKSRAAMRIANALSNGAPERVAIINTEFERGRYYPELGRFALIDYVHHPGDKTEPCDFYAPEEFADVLKQTEDAGFDIIIIDGMTPQWEAVCGIADNMEAKGLAKWKDIKIRHNKFWSRLMRSPAHIIMTALTEDATAQTGSNIHVIQDKLRQDSKKLPDIQFLIAMQSESVGIVQQDRTGQYKPDSRITNFVEFAEIIGEWAGAGIVRPPVTQAQIDLFKKIAADTAVLEAVRQRAASYLEKPRLTEAEAADVLEKMKPYLTPNTPPKA